MKKKYSLAPILEELDKEIQDETSPQRIRLENIINKITTKINSLNSAYALMDELRDTIRIRDEIDDSMTNSLQIKFGTVLLCLYVLVAETNFTMDQTQVDILLNIFSKNLTDDQLSDFESSVSRLM
tara:strand:+ start:289 stop:666 length:378 start_codon:yes stop_codon:yes gene_type:complete